MRAFFRSRLSSFQPAFSGIWHVLQAEKNAWIHTTATIGVVGLSLWLKITAIEWAVIILTISAVWAAECINTAIEAVLDLTSPEIHPLAKIAKDTGAAAVLITAIASVFIGVIILGSPLLMRLLSMLP